MVERRGLLPYVEMEEGFFYSQGNTSPFNPDTRTGLNLFKMEKPSFFKDVLSFDAGTLSEETSLRFAGTFYALLREGGNLASPGQNDVRKAEMVTRQGLEEEIERLWVDNPGIAAVVSGAEHDELKNLGIFLYNSIEIRSKKIVKNPPGALLLDDEPSLRKEILERQWNILHYLEEYEVIMELKKEYGAEISQPKH